MPLNGMLERMAAIETWAEIVDRLRAERGMSQDDLAFEARSHGAPSTLTGSWISQLKKGTRPLALDLLRGIAGALGVEPEVFPEYRLLVARAALDEDEVGLERALENLSRVDGVLASADSVDAAQELLREDVAAREPQRSPGRSPRRRAAKAKRGEAA